MSDKELLELAAKASKLNLGWGFDGHIGGPYLIDGYGFPIEWNPLDDDGDALRLMVSMNMVVGQSGGRAIARVGTMENLSVSEPLDEDPCLAMRRAIVRAAGVGGS